MFEILELLPYKKFLEIFTPEYPKIFSVVLLENCVLFCSGSHKVFTVVYVVKSWNCLSLLCCGKILDCSASVY